MNCKKHLDYEGKKKPSNGCSACWQYFLEKEELLQKNLTKCTRCGGDLRLGLCKCFEYWLRPEKINQERLRLQGD